MGHHDVPEGGAECGGIGASQEDAEGGLVCFYGKRGSNGCKTVKVQDLVGEWEHPDAYLIFLADGTYAATFGSTPQRGAWQVAGALLTLQSDDSLMQVRARLLEGTLYLDDLPFQRVETKAPPAKRQKKAMAASPQRWVPEKLSGTWTCLSSGSVYKGSYQIQRVLVLNADGSYQFSSDSYNSGGFGQVSGVVQESGQWWVEGSLLWFAGQQGQSSRQMDLRNARNGDPMIVLDGHSYVTKFRRPSW